MANTCHACGAPTKGTYVCAFCGAMIHPSTAADEQRRALDEYQNAVTKADENGKRALFRTGFLPEDKSLLIEAGVRLVPFLQFGLLGDDAAGRLEAIALKLK